VIVPEQVQPQVSPPPRRPAASQPEPDSIQVRIGAVEVRATSATTPPPAPQPTSAPQGFDDYAAVRSYAGWARI